MHQKTKINFPEVELFVVYNGSVDYSYTVRHDDFGDIRIRVRYCSIKFDELQMKDTSNVLAGYAFLIRVYEEQVNHGKTLTEAAQKAIDRCRENGYLLEILKDGRCGNMIRERLPYYETVFRDGIEQGIEQGVVQERFEIVKNALKFKMSISDIKKLTGLTEEEIMKVKTNAN